MNGCRLDDARDGYFIPEELKEFLLVNKKLFKKMKMIRISYVKYKVKRFCQRKFGKGVKI